MKKVVSLIIGALLCLSLQAHAPILSNQDSQSNQKYENHMFTQNKKAIEERIRPIASKQAYDKIMSSPFVTDFEVNKKVFTIAERLNINPLDLIIVMYKESTLDPKEQNPYSNATGLIQWLPSTAKGLGTSVEALLNMSILEQLDEVEKYLVETRKLHKVDSFVDLYLCIFHPEAVGKGDDYVICVKGTVRYHWNKNVEMNKDGKLTNKDLNDFGSKNLG